MGFVAAIIGAIKVFAAAQPFIFGAIVSTALSVATSFVGKLLAPRPPKIRPVGRDLTVNQPDAPWQIVYGEMVVGGSLIDIQTGGVNNEFLYLVIGWCYGGPDGIEAVSELRFGDEVAVNGSTPIAKYSGLLTVEHHLGTDTQAGSTLLTTDLPAKFSATDQGNGMTYTVLKLKHHADKWSDFSIEQVRAKIKGRKVLDPRTGSVAWTDNAVLCAREYMSNTRFGMSTDVDAFELDDAFNNTQANVCDELVAKLPSGTEKRYRANGAFTTDVEPGKALQEMLVSMAGAPALVGGKVQLLAGAWRPPLVEFSTKDLRGPIKLEMAAGRVKLANGIKGTFLDTTHWQPANYPAVAPADALVQDGGNRLWRNLDFAFVTSPAQCQRLAKIGLNIIRRQKRVVLPLHLSGYQLVPGDVLSFTHTRYNKDASDRRWTGKTFYVERMELVWEEDQQGGKIVGVNVHAREEDALVYYWNASVDEQVYAAPPSATFPAPPLSPVEFPNDDPTGRPDLGSGVRIGGVGGVRVFGGGTRAGLERTPVGRLLEAEGAIASHGGSAEVTAFDRGGSGQQATLYESGGFSRLFRDGDRVLYDASRLGAFTTPGVAVDVAAGGIVRANLSGAPRFQANDTQVGGVVAEFYSGFTAAGIAGIVRAGSDRYRINPTGHGLDGTPTVGPVHAFGEFVKTENSFNPQFRATNTGVGNVDGVFYSGASGIVRILRDVSDRYLLNPAGHGFEGTPAASLTPVTVFGRNLRVDGSAPGLFAHSTDIGGRDYAFATARYSSNSIASISDETVGAARYLLDGANARHGFERTPTGTTLEVAGQSHHFGAGAGLRVENRASAGQFTEFYQDTNPRFFDSVGAVDRMAIARDTGKMILGGGVPGTAFLKIEGDDWIGANKRVADPRRLLASHVSYRMLTNPLTGTDAGATATVNIAAFTNRFAGVDVAYSAGSVASLSFDTLYFIYADDAGFAGGAVTYQATTVKETALNGSGRIFVGSIRTPKDGAPDTIGNNDGGSGAQIGMLSMLRPTEDTVVQNGGFNSPLNAYDGDLLTSASQQSPAAGGSAIHVWRKFSGSIFNSAAKLKVHSSVQVNAGAGIAASVEYSTNSGSTWTTIFTSANRAATTDTVTLPAGTNPHRVHVRGTISQEDAVPNISTLFVTETWIEAEF